MTDLARHFDQAMRSLPDPGRNLAVAVSGGPDSTALAMLMRDWAAATGRNLTALVVDHGLRADAEAEAVRVASRLRAADIRSHVLTCTGDKPDTAVQAPARDARYRLMLGWCRSHGHDSLFLGHHGDDQAATVAMRIDRGSGIDGLAAMRRVVRRGDVGLYRPLLDLPKSVLTDFLDGSGTAWEDDPSNRDPRHERNRVNDALAQYPDPTRHSARLRRLGHRAARAADALAHMTESIWQLHARSGPDGSVRLDSPAFQAVPEEIRLRLLIRAVTQAGGTVPGLSGAERVLDRLDAGDAGTLTLGHAVIRLTDTRMRVMREQRNLPRLAWPAGTQVLDWDGRFRLQASSRINAPLSIGPGRDADALLPCIYLKQDLLGCPLSGPVTLPGNIDVRAMPLHLLGA